MEPEELNLEIYRVASVWSQRRRRKFPKWEIGEIINEAWIQLKTLMHRFDPSRGSIWAFAKSSLWDPMYRSYCKAHAIRIRKRRTQKHQREYEDFFVFVEDLDQFVAKDPWQPPEMPEIPDIVSKKVRLTLNLLARGLTQRQVADACGVTESAVSIRMATLRSLL